jgi:hypothetical protein
MNRGSMNWGRNEQGKYEHGSMNRGRNEQGKK